MKLTATTITEILKRQECPVKLTATTITNAHIHELRATLPAKPERNSSEWKHVCECEWALLGDSFGGDRVQTARARCADLFNAHARTRCPGRQHDHHIGDVCEGTCCTACGGPIDENEECRC